MYTITYIDYRNQEVTMSFPHYHKLASFMEGIPFHRIIYFGMSEANQVGKDEIDGRD